MEKEEITSVKILKEVKQIFEECDQKLAELMIVNDVCISGTIRCKIADLSYENKWHPDASRNFYAWIPNFDDPEEIAVFLDKKFNIKENIISISD